MSVEKEIKLVNAPESKNESVTLHLTPSEVALWYELETQDIASHLETREYVFVPKTPDAPRIVKAVLVNKESGLASGVSISLERTTNSKFRKSGSNAFALTYEKTIYQALNGENGHEIRFQAKLSESQCEELFKNPANTIEETELNFNEMNSLDSAYDDEAMYAVTRSADERLVSALSENNGLGYQIIKQAISRNQDTLHIQTNLYQLKIAAMTSSEQLGFTADEVQAFIDQLTNTFEGEAVSVLEHLAGLGIKTISQLYDLLRSYQSTEAGSSRETEINTAVIKASSKKADKLPLPDLVSLKPEFQPVGISEAIPTTDGTVVKMVKLGEGLLLNCFNNKPSYELPSEVLEAIKNRLADAGLVMSNIKGKSKPANSRVKANNANHQFHHRFEVAGTEPEKKPTQTSEETKPTYSSVPEATKEKPALLEMNMTEFWFHLLALAGLAYLEIPEEEINVEIAEAAKNVKFRNFIFGLSNIREATTVRDLGKIADLVETLQTN